VASEQDDFSHVFLSWVFFLLVYLLSSQPCSPCLPLLQSGVLLLAPRWLSLLHSQRCCSPRLPLFSTPLCVGCRRCIRSGAVLLACLFSIPLCVGCRHYILSGSWCSRICTRSGFRHCCYFVVVSVFCLLYFVVT
jgi:hypothetical protein